MLAMDTPSTAPARVNSSDFAEQPVPASPTSTDGWGELDNGILEDHEGEKDGWDDVEPLEEPKPAPALANIQAAQKRPVSQPVSQPKQVASSRPKTTARMTKNDDDDLWDSIAAPAPRTTSKPLNVKRAGSASDDDLWNAIAAPAPATRAQPLSAGRGRGVKPASQSLGAQRKSRPS